MMNLQNLSLATLSAAILASVGSNAPAVAAQLSFNVSGNFIYRQSLPEPTTYDELDGGSFTGFFSIDSEEEDTNPAVGQGTYELSSWQIDLFTAGGDLVGQLTSADGGGSGDISVRVINRSPSSFTVIRTFIIEFQDVLTGGTNAGVNADFQLVKRGFECFVPVFGNCQPLLTYSPDNALPDLLSQEITGSTSPFTVGLNQGGNSVRFANQRQTAPFEVFAEISAVPPASVPEPGTATGLGLLALAGLLKKKVAFSQKTKATVKA